MLKSRGFRIAISLGISLLFLTFAIRGVDWEEARSALARANYLWAIPIILVTIWSLYIRAQRWQVLLQHVGNPQLKTLVSATYIGFMANMVLPLRAGEVIRPLFVSRKEQQPLSSIIATVVLERIFDMFMVLLLFGIGASMVSVSEQVQAWGLRLLGLAVMVALAIIIIRWQEALAFRILNFVLKPFPDGVAEPVRNFFKGFVEALEILESPAAFLQILAWSIFLWIIISSLYLFGILAFDLPVPWIIGALLVNTIVGIAVSAPSAPGYIGAFQLGCSLSLVQIFKVSESDAFAYSIVCHISQFIGVIIAGLYALAREGMSLSEFGQSTENGSNA